MSSAGETMRKHHQELITTLSNHIEAIADNNIDSDPEQLVNLLKEELLPHTLGEERYLYPAIEPFIKSHGKVTSAMSLDHDFIIVYIREIENLVHDLQNANDSDRNLLEKKLQKMTLQLYAVLELHLKKEEEIYWPIFEKYCSPAEQRQILDKMNSIYNDELD